ncbi:MAG: sugar phosphate isomerase/epimerase [Anaerolineae bacterium]|nr:sugar phosphate isomerase/epimerase [Anaerolineae bacterium]
MPQSARVLFSTGSLYLLDTAQCFELAAEAGFDGIEIMCDDRFGTRDPNYLTHLSERFDLPVRVIHTPFSYRVPGWSDTSQLGLIKQTLKLAEHLNAESIVVHLPLWLNSGTLRIGSWSLNFPWQSAFLDVKRWISDELQAAQANTPVRIALENMPIKVMYGQRFDPAWWNTVDEWSTIHDYLTLDTTHWATHHIDPLDAYRAAGKRVAHVHLSNFDGREHRLPHKGHLDLGAFLQALADDDFGGTISLEVHPDALEFYKTDLIFRNLCESLAFCRTHLGQSE